MTRSERQEQYEEIHRQAAEINQLPAAMKALCLEDLFYLLTRACQREDIDHDWLFERCLEVQKNPNEHLDLWAREHYKSTIITFGKTIQDILKDPEITVGIFSHTKPIARAFLRQIKYELETNERLKYLFPDILWANPKKDAPNAGAQWSEDKGITVKRQTNPKEATIEANGLVDGQPTSKHYSLLIYDDVVTLESVSSPEMIKKTTDSLALSYNLGANGGARRFIGTRYHYNDTYAELLSRQTVAKRIHPATHDGTFEGRPVLLSRETLTKKRQDMGQYVFACHGAGTVITMGDLSHKRIEDVAVGDTVVGWAAVEGSKRTLTPTRVVAINKRKAVAVESLMENGDRIVHTPDHKWWTGRSGLDTHKEYSQLGFGKNEQGGLCQAVDLTFLRESLCVEQMVAVGYLAGMIDGEGGVNHRTIQITQDAIIHPHICDKIEWAMSILGFEFGVFDRHRNGRKGLQRMYTIHGGRQARARMIHYLGKYLAKKDRIVSQFYGARDFGKKNRVKLVSQKEIGEVEVFNIQTETGNYIANGYCSKNCQMLQDPTADSAQGFKKDWIRHYGHKKDVVDSRMNVALLVDPANAKRKMNDYTSMWVIGLGEDKNYYLLDGARDRMNLTERTDKLFYFHRTWQPNVVGYEHYGMQADIQHIEYEMKLKTYHFNITELGGTQPKNDRIRRLIPIFEQGRFYFPVTLPYRCLDGSIIDLVKVFVEEEFGPFPVCGHDDMLDNMARIVEDDLAITFPRPESGAGRTQKIKVKRAIR